MRISPFTLEQYFAQHEISPDGQDIPFHLSASGCQPLSIQELLSLEPGSEEAFMRLSLGYPDHLGPLSLRQQISSMYETVTAQEVLVHAGSSEGILTAMSSLLNPGDHVVVHFPSYQSLYSVAEANGCEVSHWETTSEEGWALDPDRLEALLRPNTRAIVINCPHNPTGYLMSRDVQARIVEMARARGILVFSDEVYRFLEYDPADRLPAICDLYENGISLGGMSKAYGLPGLRVGWIATRNRQVYETLASFKAYTTICASAPGLFLAELALRNRSAIVQQHLNRLQGNLRQVEGFLSRHGEWFSWVPPRGGATCFMELEASVSVDNFAQALIHEKGVLILPGSCYHTRGNFFRLGFGKENLGECLTQLEQFVVENFPKKIISAGPV